MAEQSDGRRVRMVCGACGSPQVTRDAWAEWDEERQAWTLGAVFAFAFCHRCQQAARIEERVLE